MLLLLREPAPERNRAWSGDGLNSLFYLIVASYFFSNLPYSGNYISLRERAISLTIKVLDREFRLAPCPYNHSRGADVCRGNVT